MLSCFEVTQEIITWLEHFHQQSCVWMASRVGDVEELAEELKNFTWDKYGKGERPEGVGESGLVFVQWYDVAEEFEQYIGTAWPGLLVKGEE